MGEQGGAARATYRAAAALACVPAVGKRRDPRREFGRQLRGGGEEPATGAGRSAGEAGSACGPGARRRQAAGRAVRSWAKREAKRAVLSEAGRGGAGPVACGP